VGGFFACESCKVEHQFIGIHWEYARTVPPAETVA
jgi:hypothetical protein